MSRLSRRLAAYAPEPIQVVTAWQPEPPPLSVLDYGLLDKAPAPYGPDPVVFGTWWCGPPGGAPLTLRCLYCEARGTGAACWLCKRPWSAA